MNADVPAHLHRQPWSGIDAIKAWLRAAPDTEAGREIAIHGAGQREASVDEQIAAAEADDPALQIGIEIELPWHRALIEAAFQEQSEGIAAVAELAEPLATLGSEPDRNARD